MQVVPRATTDAEVGERRKYPRVKSALRIELLPDGSTTPTYAETHDVSCSGCFVETDPPFPVRTGLRVTLRFGEASLVTKAVVVSDHPRSGNGIQFVGISVEDLNRLNRFLHTALR